MKLQLILSVSFALVLTIIRCSGSGSSAGVPLVEPPVTAATPSGLTSRRVLDISEVASRFFADGPTEIQALLDGLDTRITEINSRSSESDRACLANTPVQQDYTIMGEAVTAHFQCYEILSATGGMAFGQKDGIWYLYQNVGQGRSLAKIAPVSGQDGKYEVDAWMSVGQGNAADSGTCSSNWYGCSYGVIRLNANSADNSFEMTVAGTGFGYCGAHLKSEGTNLYVSGSAGQTNGVTWTCAAADTVCTLASDTGTAGSCGSIDTNDFALTSLGVTGESNVGTGITLNGNTNDSVHFGPSVDDLDNISGVTAF